MFNIIETPRNYFPHDNLSSNVALHFSISHWRPNLLVSCLKEVFCWPSTAPVVTTVSSTVTLSKIHYRLVKLLSLSQQYSSNEYFKQLHIDGKYN